MPPDTTKDNYDFQGLMEKATGFKFKCEFDYVGFWDLHIAVADKYRVGRVFIAEMRRTVIHPMAATASITDSTSDRLGLEACPCAPQRLGQRGFAGHYTEERQPIFWETAKDFILARIQADRDFLDRVQPERDREESNAPGKHP